MEMLDLYTKDRVRTGQTIARGAKIPDGFYRLVVHVCIFNASGEMLIQLRNPKKDGWAGYWDVSLGGAAVAGDTSREAAIREAGEELGLDLREILLDARPALSVAFENGFDDFYTVVMELDPNDLHLQASEVVEVRWASEDEIVRRIEDGSFIPYDPNAIRFLFSLRDHMGTRRHLERRNYSPSGSCAL